MSGTNLFAGTFGDGVFRSTDNGDTWTEVNNGLSAAVIQALAVSGTNLYAAGLGGVYVLTDNGENWTSIGDGITFPIISAFGVDGNNLFAGTQGMGIFFSSDNGANWNTINDGLNSSNILYFVFENNYVFTGTQGASVWRRPLYEIVPVELKSFTASITGNNVRLSWTTATETNNRVNRKTN